MRNSNTSPNKSIVVGALCQQFIQEWQRGENPDIQDYLVDLDEHSRRTVFAELLSIEIEMRREKGESPLPKDYLHRFPANQPTIVAAFDAMSATMTDSRVSLTGGTLMGSGAETTTGSDLSVGQWLGKYEITSMLGKGGMGVVYSARDSLIRREVAIKQLGSRHAKNETAMQRLLQEARTAGSLQHANIVSIYDVVEHGENLYLVMEKVTGDNLGEILQRTPEGRLDWQTATRLVIDCCDALEAAHAQCLIHRDIKPQNIMVTSCQRAKVLDFGLAKSEELNQNTAKTEAGTVLGTPDFMSPEQFHGEGVDARSDLYSLGATYFALLSGQAPFAYAGSHLKVMYAHANAPIPLVTDRVPEVPAECDTIIGRAMAKEPNKRYPSASDFKLALQSLLEQDRKPAVVKVTKGSRKSLLAGLAGLTVASLAIIAVAYFVWSRAPKKIDDPTGPTAVAGTSSAIVPPPVVEKGPLVFGTTTAFSGSNRDLGQNVALGIRTCFSAVNEQGGIHGRKLELVVLDDAYDPDRALANMKELIEVRKVFGVIGNVGTPTARVTVPFAIEHHSLFFAPYTGAALLRQDPPDRYVFNYRASYADETAAMVRYFVDIKRIDPKKIAVFAQTDPYGDDGFHGVARAMRKYNIREEDIPRVGYPRNTVNVDEAVTKILNRGDQVEAVIMVPTYKPAARFIQKVRQKRGEMQFGIVSFVGSVSLAHEFEEMGMETGEGVIVTQVVPHFQSNSTGVLRYRKLLQKFSPEQQPGFISLEGFIAAECLVEGLKKAGPDPTTDKVVDALESIQNLDLGIGPIIQFGPSRHQASNKVWGTRLMMNGQFEVLDLE